MGLQEAATGKRFTAAKLAKTDHVKNARDSLNPRTFDKVCRTIDEAIEDTVNKKSARLVWLNTGSLVGDQAGMPHASHQHLWDAVFELFPDETDPVALKNRRITVGGLIKWRVALRPEDWLVHYRETTKKDIVSGDTIYASEYWIKAEGVVVTSTRPTPPKPNRTTLDDLLNKFSKR